MSKRDVNEIESYRFPSIDQSSSTIRLVKLLHSGNDESIECIFRTFDLSKCPPYIALSYTWGLPGSTAEIILNGFPFAVGENLHLALQAFRAKINCFSSDFDWEYFWIDALCINQEDMVERNHQVALMSRIYSQAKLVVAWLGPEADESDLLLNSFKQSPSDKGGEKSTSEPISEEHLKQAIFAFRRHPCWTRLWIVQETILVKEILLLCGSETCKWEELDNVPASCVEDHGLAASPCILAIKRRMAWREMPASDRGLYFLLGAFDSPQRIQCTDPRDRVFGLLGLTDGSEKGTMGLLHADYRMSKKRIFFSVILHHMDDVALRHESLLGNDNHNEFPAYLLGANWFMLRPQCTLEADLD